MLRKFLCSRLSLYNKVKRGSFRESIVSSIPIEEDTQYYNPESLYFTKGCRESLLQCLESDWRLKTELRTRLRFLRSCFWFCVLLFFGLLSLNSLSSFFPVYVRYDTQKVRSVLAVQLYGQMESPKKWWLLREEGSLLIGVFRFCPEFLTVQGRGGLWGSSGLP